MESVGWAGVPSKDIQFSNLFIYGRYRAYQLSVVIKIARKIAFLPLGFGDGIHQHRLMEGGPLGETFDDCISMYFYSVIPYMKMKSLIK